MVEVYTVIEELHVVRMLLDKFKDTDKKIYDDLLEQYSELLVLLHKVEGQLLEKI